jgi:hypothetical protein
MEDRMTPIKGSSNIAAVGTEGNDLLVQFHSGHTYRYRGAARHEAELRAAPSAGQYLNQLVKPHHQAEKL